MSAALSLHGYPRTPKPVTLYRPRVESVKPAGHVQAAASVVGVRVIYFNRLTNGEIWLLLIYSKSARENIPAHVLRAIREEIEDASE